MQIEEYVQMIAERQRKSRHDKNAKHYSPQMTPASSLGYRCERRLVYSRSQPDDAELVGEELASIFAEGDLHQTDVRRELLELGFEALEAERPFRDSTLEISGRIDGMLSLPGDHQSRIPLEIKSCSGTPPDTADGLRNHKGLYGRYYAQMQVYLYLTSREVGIFLFKDKITGLWTLVVVPLDYDYAEKILKKAERVRDHVRAKTLPDRLADRSECVGCPWQNTACLPAEAPIDPMLLVNDDELLSQLEKRAMDEPTAKAWGKLDKEIKQRFKLTKGEKFIIGNGVFLVEKKPHGKNTRIDIKRLTEATE